MSTKLAQAKQLVANNKFKKALQIVKKVTPKNNLEKYEILEVEASCHFNEKNYQFALVKMEQAQALVENSENKVNILNNLAILAEKLNKKDEAIKYLKQYLQIDGSLKSVKQRYMLVNLAFLIDDYATLEKYAPLLSNIMEYATEVTLMLAKAAINTQKYEDALIYLCRVSAEIKSEGVLVVSQKQVVDVLNGLHTIHAFENESNLLQTLEAKFKHEKWYADIASRLSKVEQVESQQLENYSLNNDNDKGIRRLLEKKSTYQIDNVIGNSKKVVRAMTRLKTEMQRMGAYFHKNLLVVEYNGDVCVRFMEDSASNEILMEAPTKCMPFLKDYKFTLAADNHILVSAKKNMINTSAKNIMFLLVDLYNTCNKVNSWKSSYPLFALAGHEDLFNKILSARSNPASYLACKADKIENVSDEAILQSFFGSRYMSFPDTSIRKIGSKTKNKFEYAFLPFIDSINHQMDAPSFTRDKKTDNLKTFTGVGKADREIFTQYNLDDPVITFLVYGFIDQSSQWIYSVPLTLKTKMGLPININNYVKSISQDKVPNHLLGIIDYLPADVTREENYVFVSKLIIPSATDGTVMHAVLTYILTTIDKEGIYTNAINLELEIKSLQKQLINGNKEFWESLKAMTCSKIKSDNPPPKFVAEQLIELSERCLSHLTNYSASTGLLIRN
jgi:tetratricopeptide (TPR) repeat protein